MHAEPGGSGLELHHVTEQLLDEMQRAGWFREGERVRRFDRPCAWDVNCGWCREWAERARSAIGGEVVWLDELGYDPDEFSHALLRLDGRLYDAQHLEGVGDASELDVVRGVSRESYLDGGARKARAPDW